MRLRVLMVGRAAQLLLIAALIAGVVAGGVAPAGAEEQANEPGEVPVEPIVVTTASIDQQIGVPQAGVPFALNGTPTTRFLGGSRCWTYTADYVVRNTYGTGIYEYRERWDWCGNGTIVTSLPYHLVDLYPLNGFVQYGYKTWRNDPTGNVALTTNSEGNVYYTAYGVRYNYYPRIEATLHPDGTIVGTFTY